MKGKKTAFDERGVDTHRMILNSIERFHIMGIDSYTSRQPYTDGRIVEAATMGFLPVVISKVPTIRPGPKKSHHVFPFSCGDWTSNCTPAFLDRINVNVNEEWDLRHRELMNVRDFVVSLPLHQDITNNKSLAPRVNP